MYVSTGAAYTPPSALCGGQLLELQGAAMGTVTTPTAGPLTIVAMRAAALAYDTTRAITMNHIVVDALPFLDVQGMSHRTGAHMDSWHAANPKKPLLSTEASWQLILGKTLHGALGSDAARERP